MNKLVSVIIPVFNAEKYIRATLQSVLEQTYPYIEIIVVNDGSTDLTQSIVEGINSDKIQLINQVNRGASYAKQTGLEAAAGELIQYLDADDLLSANKLSAQVAALANDPSKIAVCSTVHFKDGDSPEDSAPSAYEDQFLYSTDDPASFLVNLYGGNGKGGSMIQPNAFLSPAEVIQKAGPWNTELTPSPDEDGEYFCRVILASGGLIYTPDCLNYYRKFEAQTSLSALKTQRTLTLLFRLALLKKDHLLARIDTPQSRLATASHMIPIAIEAYPRYPELSYEVQQAIKALGNFSLGPVHGGKLIYWLSGLLGWKVARRLQYFYRDVCSGYFLPVARKSGQSPEEMPPVRDRTGQSTPTDR